MTSIGIAGGGVIGSLLAWRAARAGAQVEVFDAGPQTRCGTAAAGMLSPAAELATASTVVGELGRASLPLWRTWVAELGCPEALHENGSLLLAHGSDLAELNRVAALIAQRTADPAAIKELSSTALAELEPELAHLAKAYLLPGEGQIDNDQIMPALHEAVRNEPNLRWHDNASIDEVAPHQLRSRGGNQDFDWACDCRGLGAKTQLNLRPVRGEIIHLHAPEVTITRPVRLSHRRYPVYVVPRPGQRYLVGATEIESASDYGVTVRSTLELLSAACTLHPGFAEAQLTEGRTGLRPALPDNEPQLTTQPGFVSINGLYRHGFLAGPALVIRAVADMGLAA